MVDQCAKWKILAKYQLTLRMHFQKADPSQEKHQKGAHVFAHPL